MKGWEHLIPPGDLISEWIPCLVRMARLYCPLRGSISPLVGKINPNPSYGASDLCVSEFLNRFVSLSNRKRDLNVAEVVWCKVFTSSRCLGLEASPKEGFSSLLPWVMGEQHPDLRSELPSRSQPPGVTYSWSGAELIIRKKTRRPARQPSNCLHLIILIFLIWLNCFNFYWCQILGWKMFFA